MTLSMPNPQWITALFSDRATLFWKKMGQVAADKDNFVHLFYYIAKDMSLENLVFREKVDWQEDLKPMMQP